MAVKTQRTSVEIGLEKNANKRGFVFCYWTVKQNRSIKIG